MTDREKLIELIGSTEYGNGSLVGKNFQQGFIGKIADHLLANGVAFATDTKAGGKWTPTAERLPEDGEIVLVYAKDEGHVVARWNKKWQEWENWNTQEDPILLFEEVTHWMPLPDAPKGE